MVAIVTGASRGIGKACALRLAKDGYTVVINYASNQAKAEETLAEVKALGGDGMIYKADVSKRDEANQMVKDVAKAYGSIDVLVNNAGIAIDKDFEDRTVEDWYKTLSINLIGPFLVSKYVGEVMTNQKNGKIINISSTNGINSFFPTSIDYDASKAGLINLTHNLAIQFAPYINVNCVAPGWVNTEMNQELPKELIEEETAKIYKKRFAEPNEIGKVVCFLASEDADFINDEVIKVDGGY